MPIVRRLRAFLLLPQWPPISVAGLSSSRPSGTCRCHGLDFYRRRIGAPGVSGRSARRTSGPLRAVPPLSGTGLLVQVGSPPCWVVESAAVCGLSRSDAAAPLRSYTIPSMRPSRAAVVWIGNGRRWHRGRLARPAPRVLAALSTDASRACRAAVSARCRGCGSRCGPFLGRLLHLLRAAPVQS